MLGTASLGMSVLAAAFSTEHEHPEAKKRACGRGASSRCRSADFTLAAWAGKVGAGQARERR